MPANTEIKFVSHIHAEDTARAYYIQTLGVQPVIETSKEYDVSKLDEVLLGLPGLKVELELLTTAAELRLTMVKLNALASGALLAINCIRMTPTLKHHIYVSSDRTLDVVPSSNNTIADLILRNSSKEIIADETLVNSRGDYIAVAESMSSFILPLIDVLDGTDSSNHEGLINSIVNLMMASIDVSVSRGYSPDRDMDVYIRSLCDGTDPVFAELYSDLDEEGTKLTLEHYDAVDAAVTANEIIAHTEGSAEETSLVNNNGQFQDGVDFVDHDTFDFENATEEEIMAESAKNCAESDLATAEASREMRHERDLEDEQLAADEANAEQQPSE